MGESFPEEFEVKFNQHDPLFVISVVSGMVGLPIWTLRKLDEMGIVSPERLGKKTRCYSPHQVKKLNYVCYLLQERKVNIGGIKVILEIDAGKGDSNG